MEVLIIWHTAELEYKLYPEQFGRLKTNSEKHKNNFGIGKMDGKSTLCCFKYENTGLIFYIKSYPLCSFVEDTSGGSGLGSSLFVRVNFAKLLHKGEHLRLATADDVSFMLEDLDQQIRAILRAETRIPPEQQVFVQGKPKYPEYGIDIGLEELKVRRLDCTMQLLLDEDLIKTYLALYRKGYRQRYPKFLRTKDGTGEKATRSKPTMQGSCYLISENNNQTVNIYHKYDEMKWNIEHRHKAYDLGVLERAKQILRIEIQTRDNGLMYRQRTWKLDNNLYGFLNPALAYENIIKKALASIAFSEEFVTADIARKKIQDSRKQAKTKEQLFKFIEYQTRQYATLDDVKANLIADGVCKDTQDFRRLINHFRGLGINPICLPKDNNIPAPYSKSRLPNLITLLDNQYNEQLEEALNPFDSDELTDREYFDLITPENMKQG